MHVSMIKSQTKENKRVIKKKKEKRIKINENCDLSLGIKKINFTICRVYVKENIKA